jgi:hypothetical protein
MKAEAKIIICSEINYQWSPGFTPLLTLGYQVDEKHADNAFTISGIDFTML